MGGLTGKPGTRAKTSGEAAGKRAEGNMVPRGFAATVAVLSPFHPQLHHSFWPGFPAHQNRQLRRLSMDAMLVPRLMGTNMAAGNQQKHLEFTLAISKPFFSLLNIHTLTLTLLLHVS